MNIDTTHWNFDHYADEIRKLAEQILIDSGASIDVTEIVRLCQESEDTEKPVDRVLTQETQKYMNALLTDEIREQTNLRTEDTSWLEHLLKDPVRLHLRELANVNISNIFIPFTSAESENPYHALEQKLISEILEGFKLLIGEEPSESLTTIVRSTCCDYLRSLLFRLKPLLLLEKTDPDPLTALVKQVAWEYIGSAKENALSKDRLVPPPLTGCSPANPQQMVVFLLSKLDVPERQAVLLYRFRGNGITHRDIARHIDINVEALEDLHLSAEKKMSKDNTSQRQDTRKTEKILSETDFIEDFENTWSKPVEAFATLMLGDPRHVSRISGAVLEKSLCSRAQFNTDAAWEGHEKWPGFRQLTADACRDFIIKLDKKPAAYEKASLWQKCLATLTVDEYRCLMLSTFFYKRDDTTDICAIVNKFKYPNTRTKAYSQNKVQSHIQAALKKILERSQEV